MDSVNDTPFFGESLELPFLIESPKAMKVNPEVDFTEELKEQTPAKSIRSYKSVSEEEIKADNTNDGKVS